MEISILVFADASNVDVNGQIVVICGFLIGHMEAESVFHPIMWMSHKSRRPIKSLPAAEVLATVESIDEAKIIAGADSKLFQTKIRTILCVKSKALFSSLTTQRLSVGRSIRGMSVPSDMNLKRGGGSDYMSTRKDSFSGCVDKKG